MRQIKSVWLFIALIGTVYGMEDFHKHSIKCDMLHLYDEVPGEVDNLADMFSEGVFYGRLRFNSFGWKWKNEIEKRGIKLREDHAIAAMGGSLIYKSAYLNGFGVGAGLYTTQSRGNLNDNEVYLYKPGKGVLSRYDMLTEGKQSITSLAQAYLEYKYKDVSVKAGRQSFESYLTKSNDTKMIPNTFEGFTLSSTLIPDTSLKMAYLTRQKLRDHSSFHHVLAVGDDANDSYTIFSENDDTGMHFGLKKSELQTKGIKDRLIVVDVKNDSIENLILRMNYTAVPELLSSAMIQADYRMHVGAWSVIPAFRYMQQFDDGAGAIGGANLKTLTQGYSDPESLDAALYGARVDVVQDTLKFRFGVTKIADKGDIVAPWRGFPTAGFTRAMSQYNWCANTKSYMLQVDYKFETIPDYKIISRFAVQDFDDEKIDVQADSKVFTLDLLKRFADMSNMYVKTRFGHVVGDNDTIAGNGLRKTDPSYDEIRFEINYLF